MVIDLHAGIRTWYPFPNPKLEEDMLIPQAQCDFQYSHAQHSCFLV